MRTFRKHLNKKLKNDQFRRLYEEERQLAKLSLQIFETRKNKSRSQKKIAQK